LERTGSDASCATFVAPPVSTAIKDDRRPHTDQVGTFAKDSLPGGWLFGLSPSRKKELQMKVHLTWIRATSIRTTAAAAIAVAGSAVSGIDAQLAFGQYATPYGTTQQPYVGQSQYSTAPQPYSGQSQYAAPAPATQYPTAQYSAAQPYVAPQANPYPTTQYPQPAAYGTPGYAAAPAAPVAAYNAQPARPTAAYTPPAQQPSYMVRPQAQPVAQQQMPSYPQTAMRPTYPYVAQNNAAPTPAAGNESLPTPEPIGGSNMSGGQPMMGNSNMSGTTVTGQSAMPGYDQTMQGYGSGCGCSAGTAVPGSCDSMGGAACAQSDYGISGYFDRYCGGRTWFGGVYYLFMDRTNPSDTRLATAFDTTNPTYPYYPAKSTTILETSDANDGFRSGGEIRFGSTFGIGSACDTCNTGCGGYGGGGGCGSCNACSTQEYAWEAAWWALDKDVTTASYTAVTPAGPTMIFGMKNFAGELYNRAGGGYVPVNNYFNYGIPVPSQPTMPATDGDVRVRTVSERTSFAAQNIELNFLRLPMLSCGCCAPSCDSGCGGYGGVCDGGCSQPCCGPAFTMTGMCGMRFFRIDDDFRFADQFYVQTAGAAGPDGSIIYDRSVDDLLTGFQWGADMNYRVGCRWNFFCDTAFGIYDNHMNVFQQFSDTDGGAFNHPTYNSSKDGVSFLGELRVGGSYDISCHWRAVLAYRAVAITGLALATDVPNDFTDVADANHINSDNSVVIHGLQTGFECRY
jgi:hypothetical protein